VTTQDTQATASTAQGGPQAVRQPLTATSRPPPPLQVVQAVQAGQTRLLDTRPYNASAYDLLSNMGLPICAAQALPKRIASDMRPATGFNSATFEGGTCFDLLPTTTCTLKVAKNHLLDWGVGYYQDLLGHLVQRGQQSVSYQRDGCPVCLP